MEDEYALHRCVTEFMIDTSCRCTKRTDRGYVNVSCRCLGMTLWQGAWDVFLSGSFAEFYITPMLPYFGDIDLMMCYNNYLAIPAGQSPPTELPTQFQHTVTVCEIIDSHQPGYVYLKPSYVLKKTDGCNYKSSNLATTVLSNLHEAEYSTFAHRNGMVSPEFMKSVIRQSNVQDTQHNSLLLLLEFPYVLQTHGPAQQIEFAEYMSLPLPCSSCDSVLCTRCLLWPPQAADWPTRLRDHGWPNQAAIDTIVSNGCDVVGVTHPCCRQDEWMKKHQGRLSFSRAEVTLLNSWTPVQQIIYHMLRYVLKHKVLSKTADNHPGLPELSNYHIKTLMLWECEQKPQSWWSAESSLIKLCSSLFSKLSDWVERGCCEHYFVSACNIVDHFPDASLTICYDLKCLADSSFLLRWFVSNYILECSKLCPDNVSALFEDLLCRNELQLAVQALVYWKMETLTEDIRRDHFTMEGAMLGEFLIYRMDATRTQMIIKDLQQFDPRICDYYIGIVSLRAAFTISIHSLSEDLLDVLWTLFDPHTIDDTVARKEIVCIKKAIKLATLSTSVRSNTLEMLHNELSKAYLHHSFVYGQESTYCVVHMLLAALYYKSGHYQAVTDHCKQVLNQRSCDQDGLECIAAEYLPQIDESVDNVSGLVLLYQHIKRNASISDKMSQPDCEITSAFTAQLLARYLQSKCSTAVIGDGVGLMMYRKHLSKTKELLLNDVLLFRAVEMQLHECPETAVSEARIDGVGNNASSSMDTTLLVTTLELVALEKLVTVRHATVREFHSQQFPVVNEFEVLYAYKCGLFDKCIEMCRRNIDMLLRSGCLLNQIYFVAFSELLSLLDGEMVSAFGIIRLLCYKSFMEYPFLGTLIC